MSIENFKSEFDIYVKDSKCIIISAHQSPDDDSISSVLSTWWYIKNQYPEKDCRMLYTGERTGRWEYFYGYENITFVTDIGEYLAQSDLFIIVDVSQTSRVLQNNNLMQGFRGHTVCIDHHKSDPDKFDLVYVDQNATATAEVLYKMFYKNMFDLDPRICEILMLGILGDTGSFSYVQPSQSGVFEIAKDLIEKGKISIQSLKSKYMQYGESVFFLQKRLMLHFEIWEIGEWGKLSVTYLEKSDCEEISTDDQKISSACHIFVDTYGKAIQGVRWGFVIYPKFRMNEIALSLRSLPEGVNVRKIAQRMGVGGGHDLASGGRFAGKESVLECVSEMKSWLISNSPSD